jgi:hypothetical protein
VLDGFVLQKNVLWLRLVVAYFAGINVTLGPLRHVVRPAVSNLLKEGEWVVFGHRFRYFCWRSPVVCRARHNNVLEPPASLSSQPPNNNNWANMCRARRDEALSYNSLPQLQFSPSAGRRICLHAGMYASIIYTHGGRATSNYDITRTHSYSYPFFPEPSASHRHTAQREKNILITKLCSVLHNVRKILFITKLCSVLLRPWTQKTKNPQ